MNSITKFLTSSVGKKYLMSVSGLALTGFLVAHLLGNLQLLLPTGYYFNKYAYHLETLKPLVIAAEIGLIAIFLLHAIVALAINWGVKKARPIGYYAAEKTKGGDSRMNLSSTNMLILGIVAAIFIVVHVWQFKYGAGIKQGYSVQLEANAEHVRDLYRLVIETFAKWYWTLFYVGAVGFLGFHLRHGIWSAFQSLGAMPGKFSKALYCLLATCGVLLALGFIALPIWVFVAAKMGVYGFLK